MEINITHIFETSGPKHPIVCKLQTILTQCKPVSMYVSKYWKMKNLQFVVMSEHPKRSYMRYCTTSSENSTKIQSMWRRIHCLRHEITSVQWRIEATRALHYFSLNTNEPFANACPDSALHYPRLWRAAASYIGMN